MTCRKLIVQYIKATMGQGGSIKDRIKSEKTDIRRKERVIEREIKTMEFEQEKAVRQLKREIKRGNSMNAKYIAKNYSMLKKNINNLYKMKNQISTLCLQMQMMGSQHEINEAMKRVTLTMKVLNAKMNLQSVKQIIKDFEGEKLKNEVTSDMIDTMTEGDEDDEETEDEILNKVCDELQITMLNEIKEPPTNTIISASNENDADIQSIQERLERITSHNF